MSTYTVIGTYEGKVKMFVRAKNIDEARELFESALEDDVAVVEPDKIQFNSVDVEVST